MKKETLIVIGPFVTLLGVFCPIVSAPFIGSITYMARKDSDGFIILGIAAILIVCGLLKWKGASVILSVINLIIIGAGFFKMLSIISDSPSPIPMSMQWGWGLLFGGIVLTLIGAFTKDTED